MSGLSKNARTVLREAGVPPATWARAHYDTNGTWSGDACGCPDDRCKDGFHHHPDQECGCLRTLLDSYVSGEGQFAGEPDYVIRDPLRAQVRALRRRAGQHSGKPLSELGRVAAALDGVLKLAAGWTGDGFECGAAIREAITRELTGAATASETEVQGGLV